MVENEYPRPLHYWRFGNLETLKNLIVHYDEVITMINEQYYDNHILESNGIRKILKNNEVDMEIWDCARNMFAEDFHMTPLNNYVGKYPCNTSSKESIVQLLTYRLNHLEDTLTLWIEMSK